MNNIEIIKFQNDVATIESNNNVSKTEILETLHQITKRNPRKIIFKFKGTINKKVAFNFIASFWQIAKIFELWKSGKIVFENIEMYRDFVDYG